MNKIKAIVIILFCMAPLTLVFTEEAFNPSIYVPIDYEYKKLEVLPKIDLYGYKEDEKKDSLNNINDRGNSYKRFGSSGNLVGNIRI